MFSLEYYYVLLFMLLAIVQVDVGVNYVNKKIRERMIHVARKIKAKILKMKQRKSIDVGVKRKHRKTLHRGFAFDQEKGNAPQVMNAVRRRSSASGISNFSLLLQPPSPGSMSKTMYNKKKKAVVTKSQIDNLISIKEDDSEENW